MRSRRARPRPSPSRPSASYRKPSPGRRARAWLGLSCLPPHQYEHEARARSGERVAAEVRLEFVFFEGSERGGAAAQDIVLGLPVEDVDPAIVQQGGAGDDPMRLSGADPALGERFFRHLLHRLEAMATPAFVFIERHNLRSQIIILKSGRREKRFSVIFWTVSTYCTFPKFVTSRRRLSDENHSVSAWHGDCCGLC